MKKLIFFLLVVSPWTGLLAQDRMIIEDPEITFSFDLPKGWVSQDDDYYFMVFNPEWESTQLAITYYNLNTPRELEEVVDTRKKFSYPGLPGYKHIDTQHLEIDGVTAYAIAYSSRQEDLRLLNKEYIFIKEGQIFYLLFTATRENFDDRLPGFESLILGFSCSYN